MSWPDHVEIRNWRNAKPTNKAFAGEKLWDKVDRYNDNRQYWGHKQQKANRWQ